MANFNGIELLDHSDVLLLQLYFLWYGSFLVSANLIHRLILFLLVLGTSNRAYLEGRKRNIFWGSKY